jgi:peptidoglycan-associated lipoprotein
MVKAQCDPCTVPLGGTSTVTANATDPDGDALTYAWKAATGKFAVPTARQTTWTAPQAIGTYPVTVTVNDGKGHEASDTVEIRVVRPEVKEYTFDDVHFDFDRSMIRADARETLDQLANALRADPNLRVEIEGHTDSIGTAEYNMALGERRAAAVRSYLTNLGINPDRMTVVSYGEERPRFENTNEDNRRQNRRAALVVRVKNF